ncbi:Amidase enhancer precursor [Synechococcus sp. MIT S9509]|uniref:SpoIID/LytB domain-containing protein n=1 Tax=Synechococcus sp. MIT S9504 TaxID=1801628 RepID=UPI0007BBF238|nr:MULTISPECIES: SpoIID/LytB domain-containing protein [unclassified Synechococcus]KZR85453.1 Amidase enhancer precursor [Synechococcus sp. MIT S9504]KZR89466.1 Amidase enhancer precursor [Synechococcus sp. MIT S9509]
MVLHISIGRAAAGAALTLPLAVIALAAEARTAVTAQEPQMRVLVAEGSELILRSDGDQPLLVHGIARHERRLERLQVRLRRGRLTLADGSADGLASIRISTTDPRGIWLGRRRYRGDLVLLVRNGRIQAINQLGIETYLPSVVGSEMPAKWPLAALQAQAVAARTYALRQRGRKPDFDVKATVSSQVYKGIESETPSTRSAVATTRSLVLVHNGRLINAVFHSSSGGSTEPSGEVWQNQLPYLVSVQDHDQHSPVHRWNQRFDEGDLRRRFEETGGVERLSVLSTSSTGRVRSARIQGPLGSLVLTGRQLRQRLGLKSTMVRFSLLQAELEDAGESIDPADHGSESAPQLIGLWRDSASGTGGAADPASPAPVITAAPLPPPPPRAGLTASIRAGSIPVTSLGTIVLEAAGQGYGHGVGMSQWGAHGLASQGADFREILHHYYRGATIRPYRPADDPSVAFSTGSEPALMG